MKKKIGKLIDESRFTDDSNRGLYVPDKDDSTPSNTNSGSGISQVPVSHKGNHELTEYQLTYMKQNGFLWKESSKNCSIQPYGIPLEIEASKEEIDIFFNYVFFVRDLLNLSELSTLCLLNFSRQIQDNIHSEIYTHFPRRYFTLFEILIEIRSIIEKRTQKPYIYYGSSFDRYVAGFSNSPPKEFIPLSKTVLTLHHFNDFERWKKTLKNRKKILNGNILVGDPLPIVSPDVESPEVLSIKTNEFNNIADSYISKYSNNKDSINKISSIDDLRKTLSSINASKLTELSEGKYRPTWQKKLSDLGAIFIYHSVYSVVLDKDGNLDTFYGKCFGDYSMYVPSTKEFGQTTRNLPVPGIYMNYNKIQNFKFFGNEIKEITYNGSGGFIQSGYGQTWPNEKHECLQKKIDGNRDVEILYSIVAESVLKTKSITLTSLKQGLPDLIDTTIPFLILELAKKANIKNATKDILNAIKDEVIETIIEDVVRYIVVKVASNLTPIVNAVVKIYDIIEGAEDIKRFWYALACVKMALKGTAVDDVTIAAKVLAKILADQFYDKAIEIIVKRVVNRNPLPTTTASVTSPTNSNSPPKNTPSTPGNLPASPPPDSTPDSHNRDKGANSIPSNSNYPVHLEITQIPNRSTPEKNIPDDKSTDDKGTNEAQESENKKSNSDTSQPHSADDLSNMSYAELHNIARENREAFYELVERERRLDKRLQEIRKKQIGKNIRSTNRKVKSKIKTGPNTSEGGTIAVGETDIPLHNREFVGLSPDAGGEPVPIGNRESEFSPDQTGVQGRGHAEERVIIQFDRSVQDSKLTDIDWIGKTLRIHVEEPPCTTCKSGIENTGNDGPIVKFVKKYKGMRLEISDAFSGETLIIFYDEKTDKVQVKKMGEKYITVPPPILSSSTIGGSANPPISSSPPNTGNSTTGEEQLSVQVRNAGSTPPAIGGRSNDTRGTLRPPQGSSSMELTGNPNKQRSGGGELDDQIHIVAPEGMPQLDRNKSTADQIKWHSYIRKYSDQREGVMSEGLVGINETDLSQKALRYRNENNISGGRNVAVFEYYDDQGNIRTLTISSAGQRGPHSERALADELENRDISPGRVLRVYTEKSPCKQQCTHLLKRFPFAKITYSYRYQ